MHTGGRVKEGFNNNNGLAGYPVLQLLKTLHEVSTQLLPSGFQKIS